MSYAQYTKEQQVAQLAGLKNEYGNILEKKLKLDMSRGKPEASQLDLSAELFAILTPESNVISENGFDCRNYGVLDGIPECKRLFADILGVPKENVIIGGNSSLNLMFDEITRAMLFGVAGGAKPWGQQGEIKFLCPVPGYDRHFAICELLGIKMINVPTTQDGPDMDTVERLVAEDASIKGIWCVPKYSNPTGAVYSDETVARFAALKPKADDFRIFWDNAYAVHDLYEPVALLNLFEEAKKHGNEDLPLIFTSTSKISFSGAGVSALAASDANIARTKKAMGIQTIGYDKLNQLRHARYFVDGNGIRRQMERHAEIIRPKFEAVLKAFREQLAPLGIAEWSEPKGGYFISLEVKTGSAKRVYELAKQAGVTLTPAGAPFPYGVDPEDSNLRISPTYPPIDELTTAVEVLCLCVKIAALEELVS
ncbi:MAG: aminotransferase class I/II-fold pyridoxal phosphate-dependent enzyme [Clostridia bacterium]|nr:aminotransferase class I/II-fold pyridoxal phosphate-dependent enzyme [Clostridia bacterium]